MKKILSLLSFILATAVVFTACKKLDPLPYYGNGQAISLSVANATIAPTPADSSKTVLELNWTDPKYATDTANYKYVVEIDSTTNFSTPTSRILTSKRSMSFTGRELNSILLNYGYALGAPKSAYVRVTSSYANNNERYVSNVVKITVTPFTDPSKLTTQNTSVTTSLDNQNLPSNKFSWTPAFKEYTGAVTYVLQYDSAGKNFANPKDIAVDANAFDKTLTQGEINDAALSLGIAGGTTGKLDFRVKATTALGAVAYSNPVSVTVATYVPLLRLYMPGGYQSATGNGNDWDPNTAPEMIRDLRSGLLNKMYYTYLYLPANAEFKVTQGRSWDVNYGGSNGKLERNGPNFKVTTAGVYRFTVNRETMEYDLREGRMATVGSATAADWNPGNAFPTTQMGYASRNLFVGVQNLNTGGWKMIDSNNWNDGSKSVGETRSYGSNGGPGSTMIVNGPNFPDIATAGRYRIIWDGRNPDDIKYELSAATEMRVVGDGMQGVNAWDPGSSPQMTYIGNGKWQITLALVGGKDIKFLAGNAWGAFDYEDASGGVTATGVARKIKWDGGPNFKTPATSGTYTITLDEQAQTVTIN